MTPLLKVSNFSLDFHHFHKNVFAVRDVSFEIFPKQTIALVGESGCGKSVLVKGILKLFSSPSAKIKSGEIFYGGQNILNLCEKKLQKIRGKEIGIIFQDPMTSLNPTMKVGEQILESLLTHEKALSYHEAKKKALELINLVGIADPDLRYEQYPHELSGGMRQRIMIAIALAPSPKLLIADEPTTALDVTIQAQILRLLKSIQEKTGTSILLITHDMSIVAGFCEKVMVMYAGKIIESAPVEELFSCSKHPYTRKLIQSLPRLDLDKERPLIPISGSPPDLGHILPGCSFAPRCKKAMAICVKKTPPLIEVGKEHHSACWRCDQRAPKEDI